jgi:AraC-like DNA-binding protein
MICRVHRPQHGVERHTPGVLDDVAPGLVVGSIWTSEHPAPPRLERVAPMAGGQVVFDLDSGRGVLVGLRTVSATVTPPCRARGVRLTGAGVYAVVGPDVTQLVDSTIDLDTLAPSRLLDRIRDGGAQQDDLAELVVALCCRFEVDPRVLRAESTLQRGASCPDAAAAAGVNRRKLVPLFRRHVGINPKAYQRLVRFAGAMAALRHSSDQPIAAIAAEHRYADQAHLTREVRQLTEVTPARLACLPQGPVNHLPVDGTTR